MDTSTDKTRDITYKLFRSMEELQEYLPDLHDPALTFPTIGLRMFIDGNPVHVFIAHDMINVWREMIDNE